MQGMCSLVRPMDGCVLLKTCLSTAAGCPQQHAPSFHLSSQTFRWHARREWLQCVHAMQPAQSMHTNSVKEQQRIMRFAGLSADDFRCVSTSGWSCLLNKSSRQCSHCMCACRHPLDQQNTSLIQALPGMELVAKALMGERSLAQPWTLLLVCNWVKATT